MKSGILLFILLVTLPLSGFAADAGQIPAPLRTDILQLIGMTGGAHMEQLFGNAIAQQINNNLRASHPNISPKAFTIIKEETAKMLVDTSINKHLVEMLVPIYAKYYSDADVRQMIAFYKTPLGQKIIFDNPEIARASLQDGEQWGKDVLAPELVKRIRARFQQEGIKLDEPAGESPH
ncbi:MAG TPA: DUF2059 domain-containing protein [Gammaproteobacteria bacterium]|nr:DUF2059 domain-containing protein [Gammaproteobacteria bacterium]